MNRRVFCTLAVCCTATIMMGCGSGGPPAKSSAKVQGTVLYKNAPLAAGEVNLFCEATGAAAKAPLNAEGKFDIPEKIDAGKYKVYFTPISLMSTGGADGSAPPPAPKLDVPPKFTVVDATDLFVDVKQGDNDLKIAFE